MTAITHVGMAVADLDRAVAWYTDVLGFEPLGRPASVQLGEGHAGVVARDVLGSRSGSFRQAHMTSANGVALELFEFEEPSADRSGIFHFCVVTPKLERPQTG